MEEMLSQIVNSLFSVCVTLGTGPISIAFENHSSSAMQPGTALDNPRATIDPRATVIACAKVLV